MANLNSRISPDDGLVGGNDFDVEKVTTAIPEGETATKAWMTVKVDEDDTDENAIWQKEITTSDQPTVGHITDAGSGSGADRSATLLFRLQPAETEAVEPAEADRIFRYHYSVKVLLSNGDLKTPFKGHIWAAKGVTDADS